MSLAQAAMRQSADPHQMPQFMGSPELAAQQIIETVGTDAAGGNTAVLYLDAGYYIIQTEPLADVSEMDAVSQRIAAKAADCKASAIILGSRQFGASATTTPEHRALNQALKTQLRAFDVRLLDHIVIAGSDNVSMALLNQL